jgi:hypothetical protein
MLGKVLWNADNLSDATKTKTLEVSECPFDVTIGHMFDSQATDINIGSGLKLSLLVGLVNVSGAAKYFTDYCPSKEVAYVTLRCKMATTTVECEPTVKKLGEVHDQLTDVNATHVVTQTTLGCEAYFVFEKQIELKDNPQEISTELLSKVTNLAKACVSHEYKPDCDDSIVCRVFCDFPLPKVPRTYSAVVSVCKDLAAILKNACSTRPIPLTASLCPIAVLDNRISPTVREISNVHVTRIQSILQDLGSSAFQSTHLLKKEIFNKFPSLQNQQKEFVDLISEYITDITTKLRVLVSNIRRGDTDESVLLDLLKNHSSSPFGSRKLPNWHASKERELDILHPLVMKRLQPFEFHSSKSLNSIIYSGCGKVVCLAFNVVSDTDVHLTEMHAYVTNSQVYSAECNSPAWYNDSKVKKKLMILIKQFTKVSEYPNETIRYIVTDSCSSVCDHKDPVIVMFEDGIPLDFNPPGETGKPTPLLVTDSSIELTWSKPSTSANSIESYTILYCPNGSQDGSWMQTKTDGPTEKATVYDLSADTEYFFKILAKTEDISGPVSDISGPIKTKLSLPGKPSKPEVIDTTSDSISIRWGNPSKNPQLIKYYSIFYRKLFGNKRDPWDEEKSEDTSFTVCSLCPKTEYIFKVQANTGEHLGPESEESEPINTEPLLPSKPGKPIISEVKAESVKVTWPMPEKNCDIIECYDIFYTQSDDMSKVVEWKRMNFKVHGQDTEIRITKLNPKSLYLFKVQAICSDGGGPESDISDPVRTQVALPGKPGTPKLLKSSCNNLKIQWTKPAEYADCITFYTVYYRLTKDSTDNWNNKSTSTPQEFLTIDGLTAKSSYVFKVVANNEDGKGSESEISKPIETNSIGPGEPGKPRAVCSSHNSITLEWSKPTSNPKHVKYTVSYREASSENWYAKRNATVKERMEVKNLSPRTTYFFKVCAVSRETEGPESEISEPIVTKTLAPSKPTKVQIRNVTSNSVQLKWSKPTSNSHLVASYKVYCQCELNQQWEEKCTVDREAKHIEIPDLTPSSRYSFIISAITDDGLESKSDPSDIQMKAIIPGKPGKPVASKVTPQTVQLEWSQPEGDNQHIQSYTVQYKICQSDHPEQWKKTKSNSARENYSIKDLNPKTTYCFKVYAESTGGTGPPSDISDPITTESVIPGKPGKPYSHEVTFNTVKLRWEKPSQDPRYAKQYKIYYQPHSNPMNSEWEIYSPNPSESRTMCAEISGLKSKTRYVFKICAGNENIFGPESDISGIIQTKPIVPSRPGKPEAAKVEHDSVDIKWSRPQSNSEHITKYIVQYRSDSAVSEQWTDCDTGSTLDSYKVTGLLPKNTYLFRVLAISVDGSTAKSSNSASVETKPLLPGKPGQPQINGIEGSSVQAQWQEPSNSHSVSSYILSYGSYKEDPDGIDWKSITVSTKEATKPYKINNLLAKTQYVFKVKAKSEDGCGPESDISDIVVTKALIPSKPGAPQVSKVTPDSVEVKWSKPITNPQCVKSYTVLYRAKSDPKDQWQVEKTTKVEVLIIRGLSAKTLYIFKVKAESEVGSSRESEASKFEMKPVIPGKPGKPLVLFAEATSFSLTLEWSKPQQGAEDVTNYKVHFHAHHDLDTISCDQGQWTTVNKMPCADERVVIDGLSPDTIYFFKVQAESESGCGPESDCSDPGKTKLPPLCIRMKEKSKCVERKGDLLIYELPFIYDMKTNEQTMLAGCHIGEANACRSVAQKVLMVVGATGAGKSTLINGFANYILGLRWDDSFRFKIKEVSKITQSQIHSQTKYITAYTFHPMEGSRINYTLTIVDTPGFGDTHGIEKDKQLVKQIREFFSIEGENGIDQIHGIGFVTQASLARLTTTQKYIFNSILALFGKNIEDNIFLLTTFSDGQTPPVLDAVKAAEVKYQQFFKFNNSALFAEPNPDSFDKMFWELGMKSFEKFFNEFERAHPQSLRLTQEVLHERLVLETVIQGLQPQIHAGLSKIDEIRQEEQILKEKEAEIIAHKNFTYEVMITKQKKVDLDVGVFVTNCLQCNYTCHYPCKIAKDEYKYKCAAMNRHDGVEATCKVCPQKCSWKQHNNTPYRIQVYQEREVRTSEDLKQRYQTATVGKTKVEGMIMAMESDLDTLHKLVLGMIMEAQRSVRRLQEIALKPNPLTEVEYIDLLIESEKQEKKLGYMERIRTYNQFRAQALLLSKMKSDSATNELKPNTGKDKAWWQFWRS